MNILRTLILPLLLFCTSGSFAQYDAFASTFGNITTLAGMGKEDNGNEWQNQFNGGAAINAELSRPHFAMADAEGNIYIADKESHGIRKVKTDGNIITIAGTNNAGDNGDGKATACQLNNPNGQWVKADGTLYILDLGNNKIRRVNTEGMLETIVNDSSGINLGRGIWVTSNEDSIFYANSSIIKLWTKAKGIEIYAEGFSTIGNIMQDMNGHLVITCRSTNYVYRINKINQTKTIIAGNGKASGGGDGFLATETGIEGVRGIWFLNDNTYFLATHEGSQIWYVDNNGIIHLFVDGEDDDDCHYGDGEIYNNPGVKISEPRSVSVDYQGNVIICENDLGYIRRVEKKQNTAVFARTKTVQSATAFPNPAHDIIHFSAPTPIVKLKLYNLMGELKITKNITTQQNASLKLAPYTKGLYFVRVYTSTGFETHQINIQ